MLRSLRRGRRCEIRVCLSPTDLPLRRTPQPLSQTCPKPTQRESVIRHYREVARDTMIFAIRTVIELRLVPSKQTKQNKTKHKVQKGLCGEQPCFCGDVCTLDGPHGRGARVYRSVKSVGAGRMVEYGLSNTSQ